MAEYGIAVDAMGGDNAPNAACEGAMAALREFDDIRVRLFGPSAKLKELTSGAGDRLEIVDAPDVIGMHEAPMLAVRRKTESSMVKAMLSLKSGESQAFVSAGSTGAVLAGGMIRVGRIPGIERPALAPVLPGREKPFLLIDCGANVDCQAEYLRQFGLMGAVYMEKVMGVAEPRVGLVNIGAEDEKGSALYKAANAAMRAQSAYRFAGNVEARDILSGQADVIVADGFDGNIILKYTEGLSSAMVSMLKKEMLSDLRSKIGALLLKPALKRFKNSMDYEVYGGAPLLGVNGAMIKAHGSSNAKAMASAIRQARTMIRGGVADAIARGYARIASENANTNE